MKTNLFLLLTVFLISCSGTPEQETQVTAEKPKPDPVLKGYQDQLQKAKDMEKEVLKAAERQKKAIEDASN